MSSHRHWIGDLGSTNPMLPGGNCYHRTPDGERDLQKDSQLGFGGARLGRMVLEIPRDFQGRDCDRAKLGFEKDLELLSAKNPLDCAADRDHRGRMKIEEKGEEVDSILDWGKAST
ncbi:hypothetical protein Dimus_000484 [Dionaea muscipula]